ncbi:MAG: pilin [Candidatus Adlerbacteria bacterium]|nr:pilin [Candidatus Adlerbacteria bacterium]
MRFLKKTYLLAFLLLLPLVVGAQVSPPGGPGSVSPNCSTVLGFCNPLNSGTICGALKLFLTALLTLAIPVAVLFIVYGGFLFVWARGKPEELKKARSNFFYVVIGIGIFMGAWLLGQVILNTLNTLAKSTNNPNPQIGQCT